MSVCVSPSCINTHKRRSATYTLRARWGWSTAKGRIGVLIQTARWMVKISILFLRCLVRSVDLTFAMTTLWRALHRSKRGHSWENEGLRGARLRGGKYTVSIISQMSQAVFQKYEDSSLLLRTHTLKHTHTHTHTETHTHTHCVWLLFYR